MTDVGIFRRKKADPEPQPEVEETDADLDTGDGDAGDVQDADVSDAEVPEDSYRSDGDGSEDDGSDDQPDEDSQDDGRTRLPRPYDLDRSNGPFDESEVEGGSEDKLDLGALILTPFAGSELRLDVDEDGQHITGVTAVADDSAVQLQAFAAPKSSGVWDDIRDEIADNLIAAGGTAEEQQGELGIELHARMPARGDNGRTTYSPVRFVGVDGPRWFLRGVLSGRAAVEDEAATPFLDFLRQTIVVRGGDARAPRELLELTIPDELLDKAPKPIEPVDGAEDAQAQRTADDFKPFERGPEITEVR
jgi:Protein of unknown function (DUF3710)